MCTSGISGGVIASPMALDPLQLPINCVSTWTVVYKQNDCLIRVLTLIYVKGWWGHWKWNNEFNNSISWILETLQGCRMYRKDHTASNYCSACVIPVSKQCQNEIRYLCEAGYSQKHSSGPYKYTVSFLWCKLGSEASKYCDNYLGHSPDKDSKHDAKCVILDAVVEQCEKEKKSKRCPYEGKGEGSCFFATFDVFFYPTLL